MILKVYKKKFSEWVLCVWILFKCILCMCYKIFNLVLVFYIEFMIGGMKLINNFYG